MKRCWECRKYLFRSDTIYADPRINGIFCSKCLQKAIAKQTIICQQCGCQFICYQLVVGFDDLCPRCRIDDSKRESRILKTHLKRAEKAGTPATLTLTEWIATLRHFDGMCAYCSVRAYEVMEHFIPVNIAGTTKKNCVPACDSCNAHKHSSHPDNVKHIPRDTINRIQDYLRSL